MTTATQKRQNPLTWLLRYFRESMEELRKVTWPNRQTVTKYSALVIALCVALALFFAGIDWLFTKGLEQLVTLTS
ncbi:preprotein translocase subunit SecE [Candidatus Uhrbacteria bacterium]|nr:preprotein translocase subunit SecE [Candidatus Uhrbacteria bacterium]